MSQELDVDLFLLSRQLDRSAMRAASQLPGKGPTDVDDATCTCTLVKNPIMI